MTNKKLLFVISLLITVSLILTGCFGNTSSTDTEIKEAGEVVGQITEPLGSDSSSRPASGLIELEGSENYKTYASVDFDGNEIIGGAFSKEGVKEGNYTLKVHKIGYETAAKNITVSPNTTNDYGSIELSLKESFNQGDAVYFYGINPNVEPYDDIAVRKALAYSVDWNDFSNNLPSTAKGIAKRVLTPLTEGYINDKITYDKNLDKARKILEDAGYTTANNIDITINILPSDRNTNIAETIKSYWDQIEQFNVTIDDTHTDFPEYTSKIHNDKIGLYYLIWAIDNPDPVFYLNNMDDYIKYTPEEQELIDKAKLNLDNTDKALNYVHQAEENAVSKGLVLPLYYIDLSQLQ